MNVRVLGSSIVHAPTHGEREGQDSLCGAIGRAAATAKLARVQLVKTTAAVTCTRCKHAGAAS